MSGYPSGGPPSLASTDDYGYEEHQVDVDAIKAAVYSGPLYIGGSLSVGVPGSAYVEAENALQFTIPDATSAGAVWKVDVDCLTENAATSITPKIRKTNGTPADAVVGSAVIATTRTGQVLAFTPAAGDTYVLMFVKSNDDYAAWGIGYLRRANS